MSRPFRALRSFEGSRGGPGRARRPCSDSPSITNPKSPQARRIAELWWLLFGLGAAVYIVVGLLVLRSVFRRSEADASDVHERHDRRFVILGGLVFPVLVVTIVGIEMVRQSNAIAPASASFDANAEVRIRVEGELWWRRVEYRTRVW